MANIAVFYGSDSGSTKKVATLIAQQFNVDSYDIADIELEDLEQYDLIILGTPTVNNGEIQSDWDYVLDDIEDLNLTNTKVAVFGLGDQSDYADTFVDAMADLAQACEEAGATLIGPWPSKGYTHSESRAEKNGWFVGLAIDMERQAERTHERVENWVNQLKSSMNE
ncbi:flavodoxin [Vibrio sp. DW001]|uniref:flavodoxin n=1 Tax=Vibrio sp. DW001 TaxID=2912315 RepID=UPI0023B0801C|nr:flavodoxin [Vibrio sp. DW001]WED28874.1 flavodoxin [Vibrio sp. DW001]